MTIPRVKAAGWAAFEKLTSAQQTQIDVNINTRCLDKGAGQTDTLSSDVTVASGGSITCASGSDLICNSGSTTTLAGTVSVSATGTVTCVSGSTITCNSGSTTNINGTLNVDGATTHTEVVTFDEPVTFSAVNGTATFNFAAIFNGQTRWARQAGSDSAMDIDESKPVWTVPTLTANRTWKLDTTSVPPTNCRTRVVRLTTDAFSLTIQNETGPTTLATFPASQKSWAEFDYDGSAWVVTAWGGATTVP